MGGSGRAVLGHLSWQGLSLFSQAVSQFVVTAVLARYVSAAEFGLIAAANIAITLVQMVTEGGFGAAVVRSDKLSRELLGTALMAALLAATACYLFIAAIAVPLEKIFQISGVARISLVLGLSFFPLTVGSILEAVLQREMRFLSMLKVNSAASIFGYALPAIVLAVAGFGVWSIVCASVFRFLFRASVLLWVLRSRFRLFWVPGDARWLLRFGFGLTQDRLWNWLLVQTAPAVVGRALGSASLGQFTVGMQLGVLPSQHASSVISTVYLPIMSRVQANHAKLVEIFVPLLVTVSSLMFMLGLVLAVNGPLIVRLVLGDGWEPAVIVFQVFALGSGVRAGIQISDALNIARTHVYRLAACRASSALLLLLVIVPSVKNGLAGAAWALVAVHSLMFVMTTAIGLQGIVSSLRNWRTLRPRVLVVGATVVLLSGILLYVYRAQPMSASAILVASVVLGLLGALIVVGTMRSVLRDGLAHAQSGSVS
jgi:PST family polysaccharide transporter